VFKLLGQSDLEFSYDSWRSTHKVFGLLRKILHFHTGEVWELINEEGASFKQIMNSVIAVLKWVDFDAVIGRMTDNLCQLVLTANLEPQEDNEATDYFLLVKLQFGILEFLIQLSEKDTAFTEQMFYVDGFLPLLMDRLVALINFLPEAEKSLSCSKFEYFCHLIKIKMVFLALFTEEVQTRELMIEDGNWMEILEKCLYVSREVGVRQIINIACYWVSTWWSQTPLPKFDVFHLVLEYISEDLYEYKLAIEKDDTEATLNPYNLLVYSSLWIEYVEQLPTEALSKLWISILMENYDKDQVQPTQDIFESNSCLNINEVALRLLLEIFRSKVDLLENMMNTLTKSELEYFGHLMTQLQSS